jgi:hypothetical protein
MQRLMGLGLAGNDQPAAHLGQELLQLLFYDCRHIVLPVMAAHRLRP